MNPSFYLVELCTMCIAATTSLGALVMHGVSHAWMIWNGWDDMGGESGQVLDKEEVGTYCHSTKT